MPRSAGAAGPQLKDLSVPNPSGWYLITWIAKENESLLHDLFEQSDEDGPTLGENSPLALNVLLSSSEKQQ
ncbi:hypothetical protein Tcan_08267 [Toxocara canis]|uniref:Uncharacterized protein n=1 Tax=Toxocara canis TaxID=6265 RepID=A0A0B2UZM6_TOXCA|nr:hypothetical protein Tcan_08267 [Toxocara canis]